MGMCIRSGECIGGGGPMGGLNPGTLPNGNGEPAMASTLLQHCEVLIHDETHTRKRYAKHSLIGCSHRNVPLYALMTSLAACKVHTLVLAIVLRWPLRWAWQMAEPQGWSMLQGLR